VARRRTPSCCLAVLACCRVLWSRARFLGPRELLEKQWRNVSPMAARDGVAAQGAAATLTTATVLTDGEPESKAAEQAVARRAAGLRSYFGYPALDQMAAGLTAGALSTAILQPLDVVKTRLQGRCASRPT